MSGNSFNAQNRFNRDIATINDSEDSCSFKHYLVMVNIQEINIHKVMIILVLWII